MTENTHPLISPQAALVLILLGAPGSGKGTQAKRLSVEYQIPHISTGDLFRENITAKTTLGEKAKEFIQVGKLVPDELVLHMLFDRISRPDCMRGYVLDGFPRTITQADALSKVINPKIRFMTLYLSVKDEVIVKRAAGRLICKQCGIIYNQDISPPIQKGICNVCGGDVYRRPDDAPNVVLERLNVYHKQTQSLIDYYRKKGLFASFDGDQPPDVVHTQLRKYLDEQDRF